MQHGAAMVKRCPHCKEVAAFHAGQSWCISCSLLLKKEAYAKLRNDNPALLSARNAWSSLNNRCGNRDGHHPSYAHVKVRVTREEFIAWYLPRYFTGCAVDRIDSTGHYELSNIQLLTKAENAKKTSNHPNMVAPIGKHWCGKCKQYLPFDSFHKNRRREHGLDCTCKTCRKKGAQR